MLHIRPRLAQNILIMLIIACLITNASANNRNAKLQYFKSAINDTTLAVDLRIGFYDTLIATHDGKESFDFMLGKGKLLSNMGSYLEAYHNYKKAYNVINSYISKHKIAFSTDRCEIMLIMAKMALNLGMYDESTSILFDLINYNNGRDVNYTVGAYSLLGVIFMNLNRPEASEEYHNKALDLIQKVDTLSCFNKFTTYSNYAGLLYKKQHFDESIKYLLKAETYCEELNDNRLESSMYHNMAIIYQGLLEYDIAKHYFEKSLAITSSRDLFYSKCVTLQNLAYLYSVTGDLHSSVKYYEQALKLAKKVGANGVIASSLLEMSDIFYKEGDVNKAYKYMKRGQNLKDSVFNIQNMDRIMMLKSDFEIRQTKIEKELLEQTLLVSQLSNEKKSISLLILVVFALFLVVSTFFIAKRLLRQNKTNFILNKTITDLNKQTETQIEETKHLFEDTIELKNRELASNALFLVQANEIISELRNEIKELISTEDKQNIIAIAHNIDTILGRYNVYNSWDEFRIYFEQVHGSFFTKLEQTHPDLTKGELRLCALLALNMNAKEVASITNRSIRTVETVIYRTRKKLGIDVETKTNVYLRKFF